MKTSAKIAIDSSKEKVWSIVSDIENAAKRIKCIKSLEMIERPEHGLIGTKWKETREMFGKEAIETMWIIDAKENEFFITEAKNSGCLYHSKVQIHERENGVELEMTFTATPESLLAKVMSPLMYLMKGTIKKAFLKDLEDIKLSLGNKV